MNHTTIRWTDRERRPQRVPLDAGRAYVVGRRPGTSVVVDDSLVSSAHAELRCVDGTWSVEDTASTNGTFLRRAGGGGEQRLSARKPLRDGDVIRVGATLLTFSDPQPPGDWEGTARDDRVPALAPSAAEQRVLEALCADLLAGRVVIPSRRELAEDLMLSEETISKHLKKLYAKFGIQEGGPGKAWQLALKAKTDGWVR